MDEEKIGTPPPVQVVEEWLWISVEVATIHLN
jgi:hypothetical protein